MAISENVHSGRYLSLDLEARSRLVFIFVALLTRCCDGGIFIRPVVRAPLRVVRGGETRACRSRIVPAVVDGGIASRLAGTKVGAGPTAVEAIVFAGTFRHHGNIVFIHRVGSPNAANATERKPPFVANIRNEIVNDYTAFMTLEIRIIGLIQGTVPDVAIFKHAHERLGKQSLIVEGHCIDLHHAIVEIELVGAEVAVHTLGRQAHFGPIGSSFFAGKTQCYEVEIAAGAINIASVFGRGKLKVRFSEANHWRLIFSLIVFNFDHHETGSILAGIPVKSVPAHQISFLDVLFEVAQVLAAPHYFHV